MCFFKTPEFKQPDPAPVRENVIANPGDAANAQIELAKKRKGFASTVVAGGGLLEPAQIKKVTLGG